MGLFRPYLKTIKKHLQFRGSFSEEMGRDGCVSCDHNVGCLNNKNGTHGEFRCNWLFWLWAEGRREEGGPGGL